jgi:hypothetical protein
MAHNVKCAICGEVFDRDKVQTVKHGARRYAHFRCNPSGELVTASETDPEKIKEQQTLADLEGYIQNLLQEDFNPARVRKQINEYHQKYGYSYDGMKKTLIYWYEIKGQSKDKANGGIGIIPFIFNDAKKYYYSLYLAQIANQDIQPGYRPEVKEIEIESPRTEVKKIRLFNITEEDVENGI